MIVGIPNDYAYNASIFKLEHLDGDIKAFIYNDLSDIDQQNSSSFEHAYLPSFSDPLLLVT